MEQKICPKCGKAITKIVAFPLCDGTRRTEEREVAVMCDCKMKEHEEIEARKKNEEEIRRINELKDLSLIDERLRNVSFEKCLINSSNIREIGLAKKYVANWEKVYKMNQGLLLWGDVGTGKSYIAAMIANELMSRMVPVIMTSFVKLLQEMKGFEKDDTETIEKLNRAKLLIIDDLGAERGTDYALEKVYDIIDSRYRKNKPIILTTNLGIREMQECSDIRYTRIYDRIFEMCYPVHFTGMSWRKKTAAARFNEMKELLEG